MNPPKFWIDHYQMQTHPEGGYFKEIYRNNETCIPNNSNDTRNLATSIYFLLPGGAVSHFHRLTYDEIWYYHAGNSLTLYTISPLGEAKSIVLGNNVQQGECLQVIIPAGNLFGATCNDANGYTLVGCMVSPGFDFRDFEMPHRNELLKAFPQHADWIMQLTVG